MGRIAPLGPMQYELNYVGIFRIARYFVLWVVNNNERAWKTCQQLTVHHMLCTVYYNTRHLYDQNHNNNNSYVVINGILCSKYHAVYCYVLHNIANDSNAIQECTSLTTILYEISTRMHDNTAFSECTVHIFLTSSWTCIKQF